MIRQFEIRLPTTFDRNSIWKSFWCQTVPWILNNMLNLKCQFWFLPQRASLARVGSQFLNFGFVSRGHLHLSIIVWFDFEQSKMLFQKLQPPCTKTTLPPQAQFNFQFPTLSCVTWTLNWGWVLTPKRHWATRE